MNEDRNVWVSHLIPGQIYTAHDDVMFLVVSTITIGEQRYLITWLSQEGLQMFEYSANTSMRYSRLL